jgi:hypothetical protein
VRNNNEVRGKVANLPLHFNNKLPVYRPNLIVYMIAFVLTIGMAMPIVRMNMDILYSKILGNIKQVLLEISF